MQVSRDVIFDESVSWYSPLSPTPDDSMLVVEDEATEAKMILEEEEIITLEESPISFQLTGLHDELDHEGQPIEMLVSDEDSFVQSPRRKPRKRLTCKEKGKKKMSKFENLEGTSDQSDSDEAMSEDGPSELRSKSAKRALKSAIEKLRRSTHHKNPLILYGYNEYMAHHYALSRYSAFACRILGGTAEALDQAVQEVRR